MNGTTSMKGPARSYRFSKETLRLLKALAKKVNVNNQTVLIEMAVRKFADAEGVK